MKCGNYIHKTSNQEKNGKFETFAVHFDKEALEKIYKREVPSFLKEKPKNKHTKLLRLKANKLIDKYVEDVLYYMDNPLLVNEDLLVLKLKEIILLLMHTEHAGLIQELLSDLFSPTVVNFKEVIEANIFSDLNNSELAILTNTSLTTFKRKFKATYQSTPSEYIMTRRIKAAAEQLKLSTSKSISEIAFDCGFKDLSHFSKLFKLKMNSSPSTFREKFVN